MTDIDIFSSEKIYKPFKVILVGDSSVGKTSIIYRFIQGDYDENVTSTIGVAYSRQKVWMEEHSRSLDIDLWDTAGQERFDSIIPRYFRGAGGIIVVFDTTDYTSVENARKRWLDKIKCFSLDNKPVVTIVGNKSDLIKTEEEKWEVVNIIDDLADKYREELHLTVLTYITSARSGENIHRVFEGITSKMYKQQRQVPETLNLEKEVLSRKRCC